MPEDPQAASEFALDHQPWQGKNANQGDANRPPGEMEEVPHAPGGKETLSCSQQGVSPQPGTVPAPIPPRVVEAPDEVAAGFKRGRIRAEIEAQ
jgi:hypothetical protein